MRVLSSTLLISILAFSSIASATDPAGKISGIGFYGSGASEVIFVTIEPKSSACPSSGSYVMTTQDKLSLTAGLIAAFQAQNNVVLHGTGACHASWTAYEVLSYASFTK